MQDIIFFIMGTVLTLIAYIYFEIMNSSNDLMSMITNAGVSLVIGIGISFLVVYLYKLIFVTIGLLILFIIISLTIRYVKRLTK